MGFAPRIFEETNLQKTKGLRLCQRCTSLLRVQEMSRPICSPIGSWKLWRPLRRGTVLAGRYKILETIEAGTFRAHDLALDQTVMVRQASLSNQVVAEFWHQETQQPALIRDPHLLNVLDVVSENSNEFIITEWSQGRSVCDILGEQSSIPWVDGSGALPTTAIVPSEECRTFTPCA